MALIHCIQRFKAKGGMKAHTMESCDYGQRFPVTCVAWKESPPIIEREEGHSERQRTYHRVTDSTMHLPQVLLQVAVAVGSSSLSPRKRTTHLSQSLI